MTHETPASQRGAKRDSLLLMTDIIDSTGRVIGAARIRNLSATGMMAEFSGIVRAGDRVTFTLRGAGHITAAVTWVRGGRIGLTFDESIDPQVARRPVGGTAKAV